MREARGRAEEGRQAGEEKWEIRQSRSMDHIRDRRGWVCDIEWDRRGPDKRLHGAWSCMNMRDESEATDHRQGCRIVNGICRDAGTQRVVRVNGARADLILENDMIVTEVNGC
jgi:hypothetical protein